MSTLLSTSTDAAVPLPADLPADFRSRVGAEKRGRMRERLLVATFDAYAGSAPGTRPVIDDVVRVAGVSRGTFYKYFESLDEILPELGQRMAEEMVATYSQLFGRVEDVAVRAAGGPLLTLSRAAMEPARVVFTSKVDFVAYFDRDDLHGMAVTACLQEARAAGLMAFASLDAALDFTVGATQGGAQRIAHAPALDPAYAQQLTAMVLHGLGMPLADAQQAVATAWQVLVAHAAELPWWKPAKLLAVQEAA
jgi:AcrR family transcriptional regulator